MMNIGMHLGLAQNIRRTVENEIDIKLDTFSFSYGNIKPDILISWNNIPHIKSCRMEFIQAKLIELTALRLESKNWLKLLSEKLGVITHFLSDFFCFAHSDLFKEHTNSHLIYEFQLLSYYRKNQTVINLYSFSDLELLTSVENVISYIEKEHARYTCDLKNIRSTYDLDIASALKVCVLVCVSLVTICINNQFEDCYLRNAV